MLPEILYLDTSVVSVRVRPQDEFRRRYSQLFWERLGSYRVFVSDLVLQEIGAAPPELRNRMLDLVEPFESLLLTPAAENLADAYVRHGIFSERHGDDALHTALASVAGVHYLVSWNFRHLVRVRTRRQVSLVNMQEGYRSLEIVAPPEL